MQRALVAAGTKMSTRLEPLVFDFSQESCAPIYSDIVIRYCVRHIVRGDHLEGEIDAELEGAPGALVLSAMLNAVSVPAMAQVDEFGDAEVCTESILVLFCVMVSSFRIPTS
jgi:hypothetical protein